MSERAGCSNFDTTLVQTRAAPTALTGRACNKKDREVDFFSPRSKHLFCSHARFRDVGPAPLCFLVLLSVSLPPGACKSTLDFAWILCAHPARERTMKNCSRDPASHL
jgi:hypothetical protein